MTEYPYPFPPSSAQTPTCEPRVRLIGMKIECDSSIRINQQVSVIRV